MVPGSSLRQNLRDIRAVHFGSLYLVPMFVPVVIAAYALLTFYGNHGALDAFLTKLHIPYDSPMYNPTPDPKYMR